MSTGVHPFSPRPTLPPHVSDLEFGYFNRPTEKAPVEGLSVSGTFYAWGETVVVANGNRVRIDCTFDAPATKKAAKAGKLLVAQCTRGTATRIPGQRVLRGEGQGLWRPRRSGLLDDTRAAEPGDQPGCEWARHALLRGRRS